MNAENIYKMFAGYVSDPETYNFDFGYWTPEPRPVAMFYDWSEQNDAPFANDDDGETWEAVLAMVQQNATELANAAETALDKAQRRAEKEAADYEAQQDYLRSLPFWR